MHKRLCLIAGPAAVAVLFAFPTGAAAQTCASDPDYCPSTRVTATSFTAFTTPTRDRSFPYVFTTRGVLGVPKSVGNRRGCNGRVLVRYKVKGVTVSARFAFLKIRKSRCRYVSRVKFAWFSRIVRLGGPPLRMRVFVGFQGNQFVKPARRPSYRVTAG